MRAFVRALTPLALLLCLFAPTGAATAAPVVLDRFETFEEQEYGCGGEGEPETIYIRGTFQQITKDEFRHRTIHGQGVDDQGNEYVFNYNRTTQASSAEPFFDARTRLISKGAAPDQWIRSRLQGEELTFEIECRG